jgi:hypothetical protein
MSGANNNLNAQTTLLFFDSGTNDPSVVPTLGVAGNIYIRYSGRNPNPVGLYQKQDDGLTTNWIAYTGSSLPFFTAGSIPFASVTGLLTQDNANLFWNSAAVRLGIGTNSPTESLDVRGNVRIPVTTSLVGIIKQGANNFIHSFGTNSFFAGSNAGNLVTTSTNQVGIGANAFAGAHAGSSYSVAVGANALFSGGAGVNTALGDFVMSNVGYTGYYNVAIGAGAMKNAIGPSAYNTVIGTNAAPVIDGTIYPNGTRNTCVGDYSGHALTTGSYNTFVGQNAGGGVSTGLSNTAIGYNASIGAALTNATAIGQNASVSASNTMALGGTGANSQLVGINSSASGAQLQVNTSGVAVKGFIVKGTASQTANLIEAQSSTGTVVASVSPAGNGYFAGSLGVNQPSVNASAVIEAVSTTKGVLFPRMTTAQKNAIVTPAEGLMVYDLTLHKLCVFTGTVWETVTSL